MIDWGFTFAVVVVGIVVVFLVLLILVAVCWLMGKLFQAGNKKTPSAPPPPPPPVKAAPVNAVAAPKSAAPIVENGITDEVVAAITAAVACVMGPDVPFAVAGIKRAAPSRRGTRPVWSNTGIAENTRPF